MASEVHLQIRFCACSRTADFWYWKRLLYQLSHNHFPEVFNHSNLEGKKLSRLFINGYSSLCYLRMSSTSYFLQVTLCKRHFTNRNFVFIVPNPRNLGTLQRVLANFHDEKTILKILWKLTKCWTQKLRFCGWKDLLKKSSKVSKLGRFENWVKSILDQKRSGLVEGGSTARRTIKVKERKKFFIQKFANSKKYFLSHIFLLAKPSTTSHSMNRLG